MAKSKEALSKLYAVTQIRSGIGRPYWEKRTLKALGLNKLQKTVVHKNTPTTNGMIYTVRDLVKVQPIQIVHGTEVEVDEENNVGTLLLSNGKFFTPRYRVKEARDEKATAEQPAKEEN